MSLDIQNSIEKAKNFLGKYKNLLTTWSLALLLTISDSNKNIDKYIPQKLGEFSYVEKGKENRNIYQYKVKKGDNPQSIAQKFNELDEEKWNTFKWTGTVSYTHLDVYKRQNNNLHHFLALLFMHFFTMNLRMKAECNRMA